MKHITAALLAAAFLLPAAARAAQPATGSIVAATDEFVVIESERGRRLFVLDTPPASDLRAGERVAIAFVVGEDNELHARDVERLEPPAAATARPGLATLLAFAATRPLGLALVPLLSV